MREGPIATQVPSGGRKSSSGTRSPLPKGWQNNSCSNGTGNFTLLWHQTYISLCIILFYSLVINVNFLYMQTEDNYMQIQQIINCKTCSSYTIMLHLPATTAITRENLYKEVEKKVKESK
jgi:hypothetical protein